MNEEFLDKQRIPDTPQDVAIDFHDCPYYGDKNEAGVRGMKPKNGTSWGYSYLTLDMVGDFKQTLDIMNIMNITGLNKNYATS